MVSGFITQTLNYSFGVGCDVLAAIQSTVAGRVWMEFAGGGRTFNVGDIEAHAICRQARICL